MAADALDFPPFDHLPEAEREALAAASDERLLAPGERLLSEGETGDACFVLRSGLLRIEASGTSLRRWVSPPALVGEVAVVEGTPRTASAYAEADSVVRRIPAAVFRAALQGHDAFARAVRSRTAEVVASTFLHHESPFADLPSDVLEGLARALRPARFDAGARLLTQGAADDDVYLIRRGKVAVTRTAEGSERVLATLGPGSFVGETAALTGATRAATVTALEPVDAYVLAGADARALLGRHAAFVERFGDALRARHRPRATANVAALPSPDDPAALILRNETNSKYLKLNLEAFRIFADLDGERTLRDLALRHFERTGHMDPHGVFRTVATLQATGFASTPQVVGADVPGRQGFIARLLDLVLAPRVELRDADRLGTTLYHALRRVAGRGMVLVALLLGGAGGVAFVTQFRDLSLDAFGLAGVAVAWFGLFVAGIGHELAHAVACKAFGSRLGRAGIGLLWFTPVIYVDTTDTWTLDRRGRVLVNASGPLFNFALAGAAALAALPVPAGAVDDLLLWFAGMNYLSVAFNLSPLLEFDGYYALTDLSNMPMLRQRALRFVFRDLVGHPRLPRGRAEWGLCLFACAAVVYVVVVSAFILLAVPTVVHTLLGQRLAPEWLVSVGAAAAALSALLAVMPLFNEVLAARAEEAAEVSAAGSAAAS